LFVIYINLVLSILNLFTRASNTSSATSGVGTDYPSKAHEFNPCI